MFSKKLPAKTESFFIPLNYATVFVNLRLLMLNTELLYKSATPMKFNSST
jgi:hypothetical protein